MKKFLNFLLAFVAMLLLALQTFVSLNSDYNWVDISSYLETLTYIYFYGPIALVGLFMLVNIFGKGLLRILLSVLAVAVGAAYVIVMFFPDVVTKFFPL